MKDYQMIMMIDMHRLKIDLPNNQCPITSLWYTKEQGIDTKQVVEGWLRVANEFKYVPNVLFEIKNEPHTDERGGAKWGEGSKKTNWDQAAVMISREIAKIKRDTLFCI